jgi:diketogulonate reductase-like aldo/keto reductase
MTMRTRRLAGRDVPIVGMGTWALEATPRAQAIAALRHGLDRGLTHIDTAEMYGRGQAEILVGEAIQGRRDEVFLVSKVLPENASREGTIAACERSLRRLGTDHLDIYLLHWRGHHPLAETIAGFEALVGDGKIRSYGVSNFDGGDLREAIALAGPGRIACNQVLFHLNARAHVEEIAATCAEHDIAIVGYSPFGDGDDSFVRDPVVLDLARRHGVRPHQIALAFLTERPPAFAIPKASSIAHLDDNAAAGALILSAEELDALDRAFPV